MVDVDKLSDAELRTKLVEFGFPVMPVTGATRKTLAKKLKLLLENKEKSTNRDRRSLGRYSSGEDSDTDAKIKKDANKNRRATMAAPATNRTASRKSITSNADGLKPPTLPVQHTVTRRSTTTTKVSKLAQDDFDTGSDSEPEVIEVDDSIISGSQYRHPVNVNIESPVHYYQPTSYSTPKSDSYSESTSYLSNKPPTPPRFSTLPSSSTTQDTALDRLNTIRSRLNLGNTGSDRRSTYTTFNDNNLDSAETPFLSNFTRRLSHLSPNPTTQKYGWKNDVIKEHDTNGTDYNRQVVTGRPKYREPIRAYQFRSNSSIISVIKNNITWFIVLGAVLFFIIVGIIYWKMPSSNTTLETSGHVLCTYESQRYGIDCIKKADLENATKFLNTLKPELLKRALNYACTGTVVKPYMTEPEAINFYQQHSGQDIRLIQQQLQLLEVLVFKNPERELSIAHVDKTGEVDVNNALNDMDEVIALRPSHTIVLAALSPVIPWKCVLYNKMYSIINTFLILAAGFCVLYIVNYAVKYYNNYKQSHKDMVINITKQIIDILQSNTSEEGDNFIVINHIRDMILPINDRKRMEKSWEQSVKFINENESRIRTEVQVVKGEPFEVWRWIGCLSTSPRSKTWQGQAFETQVGSVNSLPCSPTSCLKIRGMVDDAEQSVTIYDAVLSKCAHQCKILHCIVDRTAQCVYLKCADQNEAAIAYRNLHGWWYAGHLVTVKYVRLERYMQRFPNSPVSGPPFLTSQSASTDWSN